MAHSEGFLSTGHRYFCAMPALDKFSCASIMPTVNPCCRSSFVVHPAWIVEPLTPQRCQWVSQCLPSPGPAWKRLSATGRSVGLDSDVAVLVRGEQDGFYYRGTVKEEIEENERGMFLVEFAKPLVSRGRHPVSVQKTAKEDILEYVNGMKHSLLPGDKVLAPWESDMARYGPGTVLTGIETRDPLRASEDEEIMVQFWNDKEVKLPRGVALWIPPSLWERTVEMIHMPFTSRVKPRESQDIDSFVFSCSPKPALIPVCAVPSLAKHCLLCSPCWPHFHYHCVTCSCCCHPHVDAWWPLPSRSLVFQSETEDAESSSKPPLCLLEQKGLKQEAAAAVEASSPSSDSEWDLEPFPAKSTMADSAVNTGCGCLEKPRRKDSARPEWKYWKSHHQSHPSNSALLLGAHPMENYQNSEFHLEIQIYSFPGLCSHSSPCPKGKPESKAVSAGDVSCVALTNRSTVFETIKEFPRGQLTMKEIFRDPDFKLSLREEGFAASEEQRYKTARKKTESDDRCKATCIGDNKPDDTDHVRRGRIEKTVESSLATKKRDQPEFNKHTTDEVQELKFQ
ncbi:PREDICTED: uncharacterized protein C11orf16 homolog, partial [Leptosomus discolor]|uniref:uncharacterized protein C11orf16 homolog n=1 Tax=Leptosomus discolor TaxID=188344 RepID=UPI000522AF68